MGNYYDNLPGGCYVKQIKHKQFKSNQRSGSRAKSTQSGILLKSRFLDDFGFSKDQPVTVFFTQGRIIITADPVQLNILRAIQELQFRQDEMNQGFEPAIETIKKLVIQTV